MSAIRLTATAGPDGVLYLEVPVGSAGAECEVVIVPKPAANGTPPTPEDLGWPPGYFQATAGAIPDFSIEPREQGTFEEREEL